MNYDKKNQYKAFVIAILIHLILLGFIVMEFHSNFTPAQLNAGQQIPVIQAHAVLSPPAPQPPTIQQPPAVQPPPAEEAPPPPPPVVSKPKEVAFKSQKAPPPPKPEPKPAPMPAPKPVTPPPAKPDAKPAPKPAPKPPAPKPLTADEKMKLLAQKLQAQARQSLQQQAQTEQQALDQQMAQARQTQSIVDKYKALILQQVGQHWIVPEVNSNISCRLLITLAPGGTVLDVKLVESSGNDALDRSAIQAVYKASPLPVPEDSNAFNAMRQLDMLVRPESAVSKVVTN